MSWATEPVYVYAFLVAGVLAVLIGLAGLASSVRGLARRWPALGPVESMYAGAEDLVARQTTWVTAQIRGRHATLAYLASPTLWWIAVALALNLYVTATPLDPRPTTSRAGLLALVNGGPLYLGIHMSTAADLLALDLDSWRLLHRVAGSLCLVMVTVHVALSVWSHEVPGANVDLAAIVGAGLVAGSFLSPWPPWCRWWPAVTGQVHHLTAVAAPIFVWPHVRHHQPAQDVAIAIGAVWALFTSILVVRSAYHTRCFWYGLATVPRARGREGGAPVIVLPFRASVSIGRYLNVTFIDPATGSWVHTRACVVDVQQVPPDAPSGRHQTELTIPSAILARWTPKLATTAALVRAVTGGPHGPAIRLERHHTVLMIAGNWGIVGFLGYIASVVRSEARGPQIHVVWEVADYGAHLWLRAGCELLTEAVADAMTTTKDDLNGLFLDDSRRRSPTNRVLTITTYVLGKKPSRSEMANSRGKHLSLYDHPVQLETVLPEDTPYSLIILSTDPKMRARVWRRIRHVRYGPVVQVISKPENMLDLGQ